MTIINSWDTDLKLIESIEKEYEERAKMHPEGIYFWDLVFRRVVFYVNSQKYIIPFPRELDINDDAARNRLSQK